MSSRRCTSSGANSHSSLLLDESQNTVNSRTIADLPVADDLTLLRRRELEVGKVLGRGRYSEVHAINRIQLPSKSDNNNNNKNNNNSRDDDPDTYRDTSSLRPDGRYVMKHIQNKLFANRGHRRCARDLTNAIADLVTEAMYLSKLRHPHIIQLRGLTRGGTSVLKRPGANGEDYFLLLDRMEETLDQRIHHKWKRAPGPQSRDLVLTKIRYAWQMASALAYLHNHQILYRDCKPENVGFVVLDPSAQATDPHRDQLQLFDFGLARELDEPPPVSTFDRQPERLYSLSASGTRRYMAPEIFNGKGKYNYKADVFSWAVVFYECLSHVKPFADFTTQSHEELVCRLGGRPKLNEIVWPEACREDLSQEVVALLHTAWNQDLLQRPSMAQVCQRLEDLLKREGIVSEEQQPTETGLIKCCTIQVQQHFFANDPSAAAIFLQKKTSTSELTVATDPMASDSEVDDDHPKARWSRSSGRSSISSLGSLSRHL